MTDSEGSTTSRDVGVRKPSSGQTGVVTRRIVIMRSPKADVSVDVDLMVREARR